MDLYAQHSAAIDAYRTNSTGRQVLTVDGQSIGGDAPVFVIAEAAANHMCDMDMAKKLVDGAIAAGANAIKFQTYKAAKLVRKDATLYWNGKETSQLDYYSQLDKFGHEEYKELFAYAREKGITAFSTPFDTDSADLLNEQGVSMFKIASCDLPDDRLLRHVAAFGKPIVLSTGAATPDEIDRALNAFYEAGNTQIIVLACTLSYPTQNPDANLRRITALQERYPWAIIGLSDHTEPDNHMVIPTVGVALGARVVEKHYTLDRELTGSGHFFSVNPDDLKMMVENIRLADVVMGDSSLEVTEAEQPAREKARRSIVAEVGISKGTTITSDMLGMKRPADGLPGWRMPEIVGKVSSVDIAADEPIQMDMIEQSN